MSQPTYTITFEFADYPESPYCATAHRDGVFVTCRLSSKSFDEAKEKLQASLDRLNCVKCESVPPIITYTPKGKPESLPVVVIPDTACARPVTVEQQARTAALGNFHRDTIAERDAADKEQSSTERQ